MVTPYPLSPGEQEIFTFDGSRGLRREDVTGHKLQVAGWMQKLGLDLSDSAGLTTKTMIYAHVLNRPEIHLGSSSDA